MSSDGRDAQRQRRFVYFPVAALKNRTSDPVSRAQSTRSTPTFDTRLASAQCGTSTSTARVRVRSGARHGRQDKTGQARPKTGRPSVIDIARLPQMARPHPAAGRPGNRLDLGPGQSAGFMSSNPKGRTPSDVANYEYHLTVTNVVNEEMNEPTNTKMQTQSRPIFMPMPYILKTKKTQPADSVATSN